VDLSLLIWQWSLMVRSEHRDARATHHTVSAGILDALGRGFLIATAGVVAGLMFGTAPLATIGLWTIGVAAASGVACMIGSALVRNAGCDCCEQTAGGPVQVAKVRKARVAAAVVESTETTAAEERWARRMAMSGRQRERGTGRSV
jgi:hypothetical protein